MNAEEFNAMSPIRALEKAMHGSLGAGRLGAVVARAGVGKTACLVQIGLDALLRGRRVLHIHLGGETIDSVKLWYDTLFDDLVAREAVDDAIGLRNTLESHRIIHLMAQTPEDGIEIDRAVELYRRSLGFEPALIVVDGFNWGGRTVKTAAVLGALRLSAARVGAALWMTAQSHRSEPPTHESGMPAPCDRFFDIVDVAVMLEPTRKGLIALHLIKDLAGQDHPDTSVLLDAHTLRLVTDPSDARQTALPASFCTLLSGATRGAEETFGQCAERWGMAEINYSFDGRPVARQRGIRMLSEAQLQRGANRARAIREKSPRKLPDKPLLNRVLHSIWHQVETAGEVFMVGAVNADGSVTGGTGWAAEIARDQGKPVYVFDQQQHAWFTLRDGDWTRVDNPRITSRRFTGTGTRDLTDAGRDAIVTLFERSFGPAPRPR